MEEQQQKCPCCENHCTRDALQCGKGKRYFMEGQEGKESPSNDHVHEHRGKHYHHDMDAMDTDEKLVKLMRHCGHILWHQSGGKQSQKRILSLLGRNEVMTQRELQEELDVKSGSLSEILGKIEAEGFIERHTNAQDKRNIDVSLTDSGKKAVQLHKQKKQKETKDMFSCLTEEEKEQLVNILHKLVYAWKKDGKPSHHKHRKDRVER